VDELKEQDYFVEETWKTVVPSDLVAIQSGGVSINADGLPCSSDCTDEPDPLKRLLQPLTTKLGVENTPPPDPSNPSS
jgi:hypothetical protein